MLCLTKKRHELVFFLEKCTIISLELLQKIIKSFPFVYMGMIFYLYLWREKYKARLPERSGKTLKVWVKSSIFKYNFFLFFFFSISVLTKLALSLSQSDFLPLSLWVHFLGWHIHGWTDWMSVQHLTKLVWPNHCRNALFSLCLLTGIPTLASPQSSQCSNTPQIHHLMCQQRHMTTSPRSRALSLVPCLRKCLKTSLPF